MQFRCIMSCHERASNRNLSSISSSISWCPKVGSSLNSNQRKKHAGKDASQLLVECRINKSMESFSLRLIAEVVRFQR